MLTYEIQLQQFMVYPGLNFYFAAENIESSS